MITGTVEVKTYKEKLFCDKCMEEMEATHDMEMSGKPLFLHKCTNCGNRISCYEKYPKIYYVEVGKDG